MNFSFDGQGVGVGGCGGDCEGRGCPGGGGCRGCSCGCARCRHYAWTSEMRAVLDSQGLGHHPACPGVVGVGHVECRDVVDEVNMLVFARAPVRQGPCNPCGSADDDVRRADVRWVERVVPGGISGGEGGYPGPAMGVGRAQGASMEGITRNGHPVSVGVGAPQPQGLGAVSNPTSPSTVGLVAALGGTIGLIVGAGLGSEIGTGTGEAAARRAAVGGLVGMLVGSFAGAALTAPSTQAQGGA